jgi:hypothetical protein
MERERDTHTHTHRATSRSCFFVLQQAEVLAGARRSRRRRCLFAVRKIVKELQTIT